VRFGNCLSKCFCTFTWPHPLFAHHLLSARALPRAAPCGRGNARQPADPVTIVDCVQLTRFHLILTHGFGTALQSCAQAHRAPTPFIFATGFASDVPSAHNRAGVSGKSQRSKIGAPLTQPLKITNFPPAFYSSYSEHRDNGTAVGPLVPWWRAPHTHSTASSSLGCSQNGLSYTCIAP
jgi:hypothetical protein